MSKAQEELELPQLILIDESPKQWFKTRDRDCWTRKRLVSQGLGADKTMRHLVPSWQEMDVVESMKKAPDLLKNFTDALPDESYASTSNIKPTFTC